VSVGSDVERGGVGGSDTEIEGDVAGARALSYKSVVAIRLERCIDLTFEEAEVSVAWNDGCIVEMHRNERSECQRVVPRQWLRQ
jgi:hypothetical protein